MIRKHRQLIAVMLVNVLGLVMVCRAQSGWTSSQVSSGGRDLNAVSFADSKRGWVAGDSGFLAYTEDGGGKWVERPLGIDRSINDIYFPTKERGFILAGGSIFESSDGGHTWRAHKFSPSEFDRRHQSFIAYASTAKNEDGW
jgi:photosystem II stability/assembly factor-like uncharacterized protein